MIKSFIIAATSITFLLSDIKVAGANKSKYIVSETTQNRSISTSILSSASVATSIPKSDLKAIHESVEKYYKKHNEEALKSGIQYFREANSVKILEFESGVSLLKSNYKSATVESLYTERGYYFFIIKNQDGSKKGMSPRTFMSQQNVKIVMKMDFDDKNQKWSISSVSYIKSREK